MVGRVLVGVNGPALLSRRGGAPMAMELAEHSIYTILHTDKLAKAVQDGGPETFQESRTWVTGQELWHRARAEGKDLPILLGDATDCSKLVAWGLLTNIEIEGEATAYTVDRVRRLTGNHRPQDLVLRSTGERIAPNYIRPYAICMTPSFLDEEEG
jgi:hypothetical protein